MRADAYANDDLLYLALLSTGVVDALAAMREGSAPDKEVLGQASVMVNAVADKRFYALPESAFPATPRQLQTILNTWSEAQVAEIAELIDRMGRGSVVDTESNRKLMSFFGKLGRRALRQMGEPVLEESATA